MNFFPSLVSATCIEFLLVITVMFHSIVLWNLDFSSPSFFGLSCVLTWVCEFPGQSSDVQSHVIGWAGF